MGWSSSAGRARCAASHHPKPRKARPPGPVAGRSWRPATVPLPSRRKSSPKNRSRAISRLPALGEHRHWQRPGAPRSDRTSKLAFARLVEKVNTVTAVAFLNQLVEAVPYKISVVLTDNGIQFADLPKNRKGPTATLRGHPFDRACRRHGIEHRLTKPNHPWTNGQVERMNRTLKEATVRRYHYDSHEQLRRHLADFLAAYNFAKRLKSLHGLTPHEYACKTWTKDPTRSKPTQSTTRRDCTPSAAIHTLRQSMGISLAPSGSGGNLPLNVIGKQVERWRRYAARSNPTAVFVNEVRKLLTCHAGMAHDAHFEEPRPRHRPQHGDRQRFGQPRQCVEPSRTKRARLRPAGRVAPRCGRAPRGASHRGSVRSGRDRVRRQTARQRRLCPPHA
jgi:hypothetical protein